MHELIVKVLRHQPRTEKKVHNELARSEGEGFRDLQSHRAVYEKVRVIRMP